MAASVKKQWFLAKYARFVCDDETENFVDHNNLAETLDVPCKGRWKVSYSFIFNLYLRIP